MMGVEYIKLQLVQPRFVNYTIWNYTKWYNFFGEGGGEKRTKNGDFMQKYCLLQLF